MYLYHMSYWTYLSTGSFCKSVLFNKYTSKSPQKYPRSRGDIDLYFISYLYRKEFFDVNASTISEMM